MFIAELSVSVCLVFWVFGVLVSWALGIMRSTEGPKPQRSGRVNGFIPSSVRAVSSYLRTVSSGASTVARSAASVASSMVDKDGDGAHDQVLCAAFDKLTIEGGISRRVLLLGYRSGFQVWDVEELDNVRNLVSRHDGPITFMQMAPNPTFTKKGEDKFVESRPLLVVCADSSGDNNNFQNGLTTHASGISPNIHSDHGNISFMPTIVRFYSLKSHTYVHVLKFRSVVYSVRCSGRVVAISQADQMHCLDAATLQLAYTIIRNPIVSGSLSTVGSVSCGPLAVGPRWVAYSGTAVSDSHTGCIIPKLFTSSASFSGFPSNGNLVAHYAKESSKHLAAGIVTLGDRGYKKLSRYCSELLPDNCTLHSGNSGRKVVNGHGQEEYNVGMVVVRDIVSKSVVTQFRAHKSPISALCFDPSGTLLVTASVQGHNINIFKIMPGSSKVGKSYMHLYQLQRGLTNAVIQDISFSDDSRWIMISSSRGTGHLFYINPQGGPINFRCPTSGFSVQNNVFSGQQAAVNWGANPEPSISNQNCLCAAGPPITLTAMSRIRNGNSGWKGTVSGVAAAATGRLNSFSGATASAFHDCKGSETFGGGNSPRAKFDLLVFSPSGSMILYSLRIPNGILDPTIGLGNSPYDSPSDSNGMLLVEATRKWNVCQKQNQREWEDRLDVYGKDNGNVNCKKVYPEGIIKGNPFFHGVGEQSSKFRSNGNKHHLYISEAELHMHPAQIPLWTKPGIYFQPFSIEGIQLDNENTSLGEIPIERIPTLTAEVRSKDLVPVFDYLQVSKNQTGIPKLGKAKASSEISPHNGIEGVAFGGHQTMTEETKNVGFVNSITTLDWEAQLSTGVNNKGEARSSTQDCK